MPETPLPASSLFEVAAGGAVIRRADDGTPLYLLVRRPRHGDWSLPKGKYEPEHDASLMACAVREVLEETGVRARPSAYAGQTLYPNHGRWKLVLFWLMTVEDEGRFEPNEEVAELAWLGAAEAQARLTYPGERALLATLVAARPAFEADP